MGEIKVKITKAGKKHKLAITGCTELLPATADPRMRAIALLEDALRELGGPRILNELEDEPAPAPTVGAGWAMAVSGKAVTFSHPQDDQFNAKGVKTGDLFALLMKVANVKDGVASLNVVSDPDSAGLASVPARFNWITPPAKVTGKPGGLKITAVFNT